MARVYSNVKARPAVAKAASRQHQTAHQTDGQSSSPQYSFAAAQLLLSTLFICILLTAVNLAKIYDNRRRLLMSCP
jgi:hypothetical protein